MNMIKIVDVVTGTDIEREMTEEEISDLKEQQKNAIAELKVAEAEAEAKATQRQVILSRLGITEEEARILLGGN